jgi:endonuclease YncB( thermonuclease family)
MEDTELHNRLLGCDDHPKPFDFNNLDTVGKCFRIHDGDSCRALIEYKGELITLTIRVAGIDCPEISAKRGTLERKLAQTAKERVIALIDGQIVRLKLQGYGKYGGRVIARILLLDGRDLSDVLISEGLAFPYEGGKKRHDWECISTYKEETD